MLPAATLADALAALRDEDRFEEHDDAEDVPRIAGAGLELAAYEHHCFSQRTV